MDLRYGYDMRPWAFCSMEYQVSSDAVTFTSLSSDGFTPTLPPVSSPRLRKGSTPPTSSTNCFPNNRVLPPRHIPSIPFIARILLKTRAISNNATLPTPPIPASRYLNLGPPTSRRCKLFWHFNHRAILNLILNHILLSSLPPFLSKQHPPISVYAHPPSYLLHARS